MRTLGVGQNDFAFLVGIKERGESKISLCYLRGSGVHPPQSFRELGGLI